ncbi:MAG: serine/threonine protein kinase [Actinobacteria bacterium]|nr:serine/threonine protein kinase [Actinomycetota bacterium]
MPETIAGRYALLANIGAGGSADVWQARDTVLQRDVAIKRFAAGHCMDDAMARELGALSSLDHPGIVRLYDAGVEDERAYLVVELVEGPTLKERLSYGPLTLEQARILGRDIAEALAHAHEHNLVHQDVTPTNILLEEGRARLTDFGICTPPRRDADAHASIATTPGYTAVEQLLGGPICPAADVHALGLVLLEALTGHKEFDGSPLAAAVARVRRQPAIPQDLPSPWPQLLSAMTARDPVKRPSAATVAAYLDAYQVMDLPPLDTAPTAQQVASDVRELALASFVRRHPRIAVTIAAVLTGFAMSWPLQSVSEGPQAEVTPGVMASEVPAGEQVDADQ